MENRVIALGFFDGVHSGHAALLLKTIQRAKERGVRPAVLTFTTHPSGVVSGEEVRLINTCHERCGLIRGLFGIDEVILWEFDRALMQLPPQEFLDRVRLGLGAVHLVAGYDYRFGCKGAGDARELAAYAEQNGLGVDIVEPVICHGQPVSSTRIRRLIAQGDMQGAQELLGHPHCMAGEVMHGAHIGRTIGLPTLNLHYAPQVLTPKFGVYESRVHLQGEVYPAITNIGVRPTVSCECIPKAETHIPGFNRDVYGREIWIEFCRFIRQEKKFSSIDELRRQIERDIAEIG